VRRGGLTDPQGRKREQNITDRCKVLSGDERSDCYARMRGEGTTSGSVAGGGNLREKVTIEPVPQRGSAAPMPSGNPPPMPSGSTSDSTRR